MALYLLEQRQFPGAHDGGDLAGEVLADAGQFLKVGARLDELRHAARVSADHPRGVAIGADAERVLLADLEQIGELLEHVRNLGVVDRHDCVPRLAL